MRHIYLLAALVIAGCTKHSEPDTPLRSADVYRTDQGSPVYDITLRDGTRCVVSSNCGVACDWSSRSEVDR
jgi:hypothetical protein